MDVTLPVRKNYIDGAEGFISWCEDFMNIPIYLNGLPCWAPVGNLPTVVNPDTGRCSRDMWDFQKNIVRECLVMENGKFKKRLIVLCWMRGEGKSYQSDSLVLMYNGELRKVQDIKIGDLLMGDDNTPRKVLELGNGKEEMMEVVPNKGESFVVTKCHKLSLKRVEIKRKGRLTKEGLPFVDTHAGEIVDISVEDYMKQSKFFKRMHLLYKIGVEFPEQSVNIDPYYLGLWLADGTALNTSITTMDKEVIDYIEWYAKELNLGFSIYDDGKSKAIRCSIVKKEGLNNPLLDKFREYNLIENKHVPQVYKSNSREIRLKILAGIIDGDGYLNRNSFQITLKNEVLANDVAFLARSLGFFVEIKKCKKGIKETGFVGDYFCVGISGDCSIIPCKVERRKAEKRSDWKDVLVTGIKEIRSAGEQEYYGFLLDGNHRFVTGDFTVTNNSLLVCMIQLWKFFNFPRQQIMLGANSRDQVKFVHFDIMKDIVINSPALIKIVGKKNVQEKEIKLRNSKGDVVSMIRSISSFSGIVSNITGYTFSEMFDMKNPRFFTQLDGSIRNIPNALGVIDSTVSAKEHILYGLYDSFRKGLDSSLYFSHRESLRADAKDFTNPEMTQQQLDSYKAKFPLREFAMYFKNTWDAGSVKMFPESVVMGMRYIGVGNSLGEWNKMLNVLKRYCTEKEENKGSVDIYGENAKALEGLIDIESIYKLGSEFGLRRSIDIDELEKLSNVFDTNFALCVGVDRADPMKADLMAGARTIITLVAKGLPGSRSNPFLLDEESEVHKYMYFVIDVNHVQENDMNTIKKVVEDYIVDYDGVDTLCTERWGMWDIGEWCEELGITFEAITATYTLQCAGFSELYNLLMTGRIKSPRVNVPGTRDNDIIREELLVFDHDPLVKFYGSPEKNDKFGIQDDSIYSLNWGIYGGRLLTVTDFHARHKVTSLGEYYEDKSTLVGKYK